MNKKLQLLLICFVVVLLCIAMADQFFGVLPPMAASAPLKEVIRISDFSPDGSKLYLDYCDANRHCDIGLYDLKEQQTSLFVPQGTQDNIASPSSSDDGKNLAIVIKEATNNHETFQIGILDLATNTYRTVTRSSTIKEWPSFSHDGKKIIYAQANRMRESGKTRYSDWDIYEIELATGVERQLTNFCFFLIGRPRYMADNKRFVFSAEEPNCNFPKPNTSYGQESYTNSQNGRALYKQLYQRNWNFMMAGNETTLKPILISGEQSSGATLSRDGKKIFFESITTKMDNSKEFAYNYDLFVFEDGAIRRLTNLKTMLTGFEVSSHGEQVAYQSDKERNHEEALWMLDVNSEMHSKIDLGKRSSFAVIKVTDKQQGKNK